MCLPDLERQDFRHAGRPGDLHANESADEAQGNGDQQATAGVANNGLADGAANARNR